MLPTVVVGYQVLGDTIVSKQPTSSAADSSPDPPNATPRRTTRSPTCGTPQPAPRHQQQSGRTDPALRTGAASHSEPGWSEPRSRSQASTEPPLRPREATDRPGSISQGCLPCPTQPAAELDGSGHWLHPQLIGQLADLRRRVPAMPTEGFQERQLALLGPADTVLGETCKMSATSAVWR